MNGKSTHTVFVLSQLSGRSMRRLLILGVCLLCLASGIRAGQQQHAQPSPDTPSDQAPPPMKYVPDEARRQLSLAKDAKARTRLSLALADEQIHRAATFTTSEQYEAAGRELGIYQAIIEDAIRYVQQGVSKRDKQRDLFKYMELSLREHMPRIETIRRITPSEDAVHVKACMDFVRSARVEALNSFFDDTVIRLPAAKNEKPSGEGSKAQGTSLTAPEKKPEQP